MLLPLPADAIYCGARLFLEYQEFVAKVCHPGRASGRSAQYGEVNSEGEDIRSDNSPTRYAAAGPILRRSSTHRFQLQASSCRLFTRVYNWRWGYAPKTSQHLLRCATFDEMVVNGSAAVATAPPAINTARMKESNG